MSQNQAQTSFHIRWTADVRTPVTTDWQRERKIYRDMRSIKCRRPIPNWLIQHSDQPNHNTFQTFSLSCELSDCLPKSNSCFQTSCRVSQDGLFCLPPLRPPALVRRSVLLLHCTTCTLLLDDRRSLWQIITVVCAYVRLFVRGSMQ